MQDPFVEHSYVQLNSSCVHLVQYGLGESILKFPFSSSALTNQDSSLISCSTRSASESLSSRQSKSSNSHIKLNDTIIPKKQLQKLIVFIPGNPGILGIYHDFLVSLFQILSAHLSTRRQPPTILAISHNNFDHPETGVQYKIRESVCLEEGDLNFAERALAANYIEDPHHVELQVLNKLIILKRLLKTSDIDYKIVFVGHSIGCYIILRLLQDRTLSASHVGTVMIHPALENLALTQSGLKFSRVFAYKLDLVARPIALLLDKLLPKPAKLALTKWFCSSRYVKSSSEVALESVAQLVCQRTLYALVQMAKSEFQVVKDLNTDTLIKPHISKLKLIYAINDHWVNTDNRRLLKDLYPDLHVEEQDKMHAFVMDPQTVREYSVKVGQFIKNFIDDIDKVD